MTKKIRLSVDDLRIESFATTDQATRSPGTVHGQSIMTQETCGLETCGGPGDTCAACASFGATMCTCWYTNGCACGGGSEGCPETSECPGGTMAEDITCAPGCHDT